MSTSEVLTDEVGTPFSFTFALDLKTGEFFTEDGRFVLTFTDISADILSGEGAMMDGSQKFKLNRISGLFERRGYRKEDSGCALVVQTGTFTVRKKEDKVF
jgi:hypothetical protein